MADKGNFPGCPGKFPAAYCDAWDACNKRKLCRHLTVAPIDLIADGVKPALHFVGFRDPQQRANAVRLFGDPDFDHVTWDVRAKADIVPGWDRVVFAKYDPNDVPCQFAYDDSNQPDDPAAAERNVMNAARSKDFSWL